MGKYLVGALVIILLIVGGYYLSHRNAKSSSQASNNMQAMQVATSTYATTTFSIVYPSDFIVDARYANDSVNPKKPIHGVKFTIPGSMATGTNLASDTYVSVESLPRAKKCTGDIYIAANVHATPMMSNGVQYSVASTTGAAAGNLYEEHVYALSDSKPCTAVRYFIHSGNIGNYPPGTVREFDHSALLSMFDTIRRSLVLPQPLTP